MISRRVKNLIAERSMAVITTVMICFFVVLIFGLYKKSSMILYSRPLGELLLGRQWFPLRGEFGFYPFIVGTLWVTFVAMVIATPLSVLTSIYLSEYAHRAIRSLLRPLIHFLAAIPSVVFGLWGVLVVVPFIRKFLAPHFGIFSSGYCVLAAGIVLAIMVFPIIISISEEVLRSVPLDVREASLSLGSSHWQTVKHVVIRKAAPGLVAAVILGFVRAFGETMAVLLVVGNVARIPRSVFDPAYTLPTLIANNYGEMMSVPLYDSALMLAAFVLLGIVAFFSFISRVVLVSVTRNS